jgi:hypothetical protein
VVNLQVLPAAAVLATPAVALENLPVQCLVDFPVQPDPPSFWADAT